MITPFEFSPDVPVPGYDARRHPALYIVFPDTYLSGATQNACLATLGSRYAEVIMANIFGIENGRVESPYADWVKTEAGDQYQLVRLWTPEHPIGPQKAAAIGRVVVHTINEMQRAEEQEHMALSGALTFHGRVSTYQEMPPDILARYTNQAPWDGGS